MSAWRVSSHSADGKCAEVASWRTSGRVSQKRQEHVPTRQYE